MLAKRIIPCLDVKEGKVVKGVKFQAHQVVGDIIALASHYAACGADELVFYDITASSEGRTIDLQWVSDVAACLDIPFCVAGGIRTFMDAQNILNAGADKISINSPALENPDLIDELVSAFGSQCIVIGMDSLTVGNEYKICQYTGSVEKTKLTKRHTLEWVKEVQARGAGEIVLNCMNNDGVRQGYDIAQLKLLGEQITVPFIASGGAGSVAHFAEVFAQTKVDGALAASVFHRGEIEIPSLKQYLQAQGVRMRQ